MAPTTVFNPNRGADVVMKSPHRRQFLHLAAGAAALTPLSRAARAQTYPSRPVRVLVPVAPGGQTDILARMVAHRLSDSLGKQFYVENVPGAGSNIGIGRAAQAARDGYTILFVDHIAFTGNPTLYKKVPYDPVGDFEPVAIAATTMQVLAVHPSVPAQTVQELVALIRDAPDKYSYSSAGVGTGAHLTGELFRTSLKLDLVHVPYGGGGPAIAATVAGHTPLSFGSAAATIPQHREGKLRALAVSGKKRVAALPAVPTFREAGYPEVECDAAVGVLVPAKTPAEVVTLLNREIAAAVALPEVQERLATLGFEITTTTPDEFARFLKLEAAKWASVLRVSGIKID
jgi:tripartite-type tricarboxylate transporter receptor subunit TctC